MAQAFRIGVAWHRGWRVQKTIEGEGEDSIVERTKAKGAEIRRLMSG